MMQQGGRAGKRQFEEHQIEGWVAYRGRYGWRRWDGTDEIRMAEHGGRSCEDWHIVVVNVLVVGDNQKAQDVIWRRLRAYIEWHMACYVWALVGRVRRVLLLR